MNELVIIAAVAKNNVIGNGNEIPWYFPEDLQRFKRLTLNHPVIMGRKTYASIVDHIGKPLPKRTNLVLSRDKNFRAEGIIPCLSLEEAVVKAHDIHDVAYVIGGQRVYEESIDRASRMELTEIHRDHVGDVFFPQWERSGWTEEGRENKGDYSFVKYVRKTG